MNRLILIGNLCADPELRTTVSGKSVCNFRLAVPRNYKTNGTYESDFIDCVAWRNTAEFISKFFKKGNLVCVEGSLQQRSWEQDGQKRFVLEVMVDNTYFVESKKEESDPMDLIEEVPLERQGLFSGETFSAVDDDLPF